MDTSRAQLPGMDHSGNDRKDLQLSFSYEATMQDGEKMNRTTKRRQQQLDKIAPLNDQTVPFLTYFLCTLKK